VRALLDACLDIEPWVDDLVGRRPYDSWEALQVSASEASAKITWNQVAGALARHPRIGEKSTGTDADAKLSATEQAGVQADQVADFAAGNRAYEARFGHIFLICAAGLSGDQMLASLRLRITNDAETERSVVISELRKIAHLRLAKAVTA
jgi:2-oxo-4-hydroxy-4-carboxy-5-ureidoimidazoline decarboxylase